jgi:antitoxin ParD1/3/4
VFDTLFLPPEHPFDLMTKRKTMNVSITPELKRSVAEWVASGRYRTASEVVRAALRLLEKEEREAPPRLRPQRTTGDDDAE